MQKILLLFVLSITSYSYAAPTPDRDIKCVLDSSDLYAPGTFMTSGKYKGQCMDVSEKRAVLIRSETDDQIVFANFFHEGRFWQAIVPKHGVDRVLFHTEYFESDIPLVKPAHAEARIQMKAGYAIHLIPQTNQPVAEQDMSDFLYSVDYVAPKGVEYELTEGMQGAYKTAYTFLSTQSLVVDLLDDEVPDTVNQYILKMTDDEKNNFLIAAIHKSHNADYQNTYDTFKLNCATELFNVIDSVMTYKPKVAPFTISILQFSDPVVKPALKALKERKLIDKNSQIQSLNVEFGIPVVKP